MVLPPMTMEPPDTETRVFETVMPGSPACRVWPSTITAPGSEGLTTTGWPLMVVMVADAGGAGAGIAIVVAWPGASDAPPTMIPDGSEGSAEIT